MGIEGLVLDKPAPNIELAVGLRTYLEITKVTVPAEAEAGTTVAAVIEVTNVSAQDIQYVTVTAEDGVGPWQGGTQTLFSGSKGYWVLSFIMPNQTVDFDIYAWYWDGSKWVYDDVKHITVAVPPVVGWTLLDSKTLTVKVSAVPPPVGWSLLDSKTLTVKVSAVPPPVGWSLLDSKTLTVTPTAPPPVGWSLLDSVTMAITAGPISPEYELIQRIITPWGYFYEGDAEVASISFTLIKGTTLLAGNLANRFAEELKARGCELLEGELYKDAISIIQDRYLVKISYVVPTGVSGVGAIGGVYIPPIVWNILFVALIGALVAFLVSRAVNWVKSMVYSPPPLSEDVKKQWQAEDPELIPRMIIALRPQYSPEELAGKTDQELRDLLNEIYEEEVPPRGIPWWGWAILGGVGIAGGALAYRFISPLLPKKKEERK